MARISRSVEQLTADLDAAVARIAALEAFRDVTYPAHTHGIAAPTTDADVLKATGSVANVEADDVGTVGTRSDVVASSGAVSAGAAHTHGANVSCAVGCTPANHAATNITRSPPLDIGMDAGSVPSKVAVVTSVPVTARSNLVQASGAAKVAAVTAIPAATGAPL